AAPRPPVAGSGVYEYAVQVEDNEVEGRTVPAHARRVETANGRKRRHRIVRSDLSPSATVVRRTFSGEMGRNWTGTSKISARSRSRRESSSWFKPRWSRSSPLPVREGAR